MPSPKFGKFFSERDARNEHPISASVMLGRGCLVQSLEGTPENACCTQLQQALLRLLHTVPLKRLERWQGPLVRCTVQLGLKVDVNQVRNFPPGCLASMIIPHPAAIIAPSRMQMLIRAPIIVLLFLTDTCRRPDAVTT
jgi:hypothetical protein